jgi:hypothetical protein
LLKVGEVILTICNHQLVALAAEVASNRVSRFDGSQRRVLHGLYRVTTR